jgi:hypothetical protein
VKWLDFLIKFFLHVCFTHFSYYNIEKPAYMHACTCHINKIIKSCGSRVLFSMSSLKSERAYIEQYIRETS